MTIPEQQSTATLSPLWETAAKTMRAFSPFYQEETTMVMQSLAPHWIFILIAMANEPRRLTVEQLHAIYPYTHPQALEEALRPHVERGYLQALRGATNGGNGSGNAVDGYRGAVDGYRGAVGGYRVTDAGRKVIESLFGDARRALRNVEPLPRTELEELRDLLRAIVDNVQLSQPAYHSLFHAGRHTDPGAGAGLAAQIVQYLTDLFYWHTDAHTAAWQATAIAGSAREPLTLLGRESPQTVEALSARLASRGYTREAYAAALETLATGGFVRFDGEQAALLDKGRRLLEAVEERTAQSFFAPWQILNEAQLARLNHLLQKAHGSLKKLARTRMWPLMFDVVAAVQPLVVEEVRQTMQEQLPGVANFHHLRMAREIEPEPYTVQQFLTRFPYANPHHISAQIQAVAAQGYLAQDGDDYTLTVSGRRAVDAIKGVFYAAMGEIEALPEEQMERLAALLRRLVEAAWQADTPSKACLKQTYNSAQPTDYAALALAYLSLDDLNAFRDDAHTTAWAGYFVTGRDWETLTLVWQGQASDAAAIAKQLAFRGWDEAGYQQSLNTLQQRGWLMRDEGGYAMTPEGAALRQRVEEETDDLFYKYWDHALTGAEQDELRTLLINLKVRLRTVAASEEPSPATV